MKTDPEGVDARCNGYRVLDMLSAAVAIVFPRTTLGQILPVIRMAEIGQRMPPQKISASRGVPAHTPGGLQSLFLNRQVRQDRQENEE